MKKMKRSFSLLCLMSILMLMLLPFGASADNSPYLTVTDRNGNSVGYGLAVMYGGKTWVYTGMIASEGNTTGFGVRDSSSATTAIDFQGRLHEVDFWTAADYVQGNPVFGGQCPVVGEKLWCQYVDSSGNLQDVKVTVGSEYILYEDGTALVKISQNMKSTVSSTIDRYPVFFSNQSGYIAGVMTGGTISLTNGGTKDGFEYFYVEWFDKNVFSSGSGSSTPAPSSTPGSAPSATPGAASTQAPASYGEKATDLDPEKHSGEGEDSFPTWAIVVTVAAVVGIAVVLFLVLKGRKAHGGHSAYVSQGGHTVGLDQAVLEQPAFKQNYGSPGGTAPYQQGPSGGARFNGQVKPQAPFDPDDSGYRIVGTAGYLQGRRLRVPASGALVFGRTQQDCNVLFPTDTKGVSGRHCKVWMQNGGVYLMDLGSSNGTFLADGTKLSPNKPVRLHSGHTFSLGSNKQQVQLVRKS